MELRLPYQQGLQLNLSAAKRTGRNRLVTASTRNPVKS